MMPQIRIFLITPELSRELSGVRGFCGQSWSEIKPESSTPAAPAKMKGM
jgi:hypothetical protein